MAKKKKEEIPVIKEKKSGISVGSSHNVKLTLMKNNKKIKELKYTNKATRRLLYGICLMLKGGFSSINSASDIGAYIPRYLGVGEAGDEVTNADGSISVTAAPSSLYDKLANELNINPRFPVIPKTIIFNDDEEEIQLVLTSAIHGGAIDTVKIAEMGLFSSPYTSNDTLLARVLLYNENKDPWIELEPGYSLYVEWTITLNSN